MFIKQSSTSSSLMIIYNTNINLTNIKNKNMCLAFSRLCAQFNKLVAPLERRSKCHWMLDYLEGSMENLASFISIEAQASITRSLWKCSLDHASLDQSSNLQMIKQISGQISDYPKINIKTSSGKTVTKNPHSQSLWCKDSQQKFPHTGDTESLDRWG